MIVIDNATSFQMATSKQSTWTLTSLKKWFSENILAINKATPYDKALRHCLLSFNECYQEQSLIVEGIPIKTVLEGLYKLESDTQVT